MIRGFFNFLILIWQKRALIWQMAKRDLAAKYAGSWLGVIWAFIHPLSLICIFWFVFGFGLRAQPVENIDFTSWLTAGLAAWFCFSEIVSESTHIITSNAYLIKKVVFPSHILPVVKVVASLLNHLVFLLFLLGLLVINQIPLTWYALQLPYYFLCLISLALGISWMTSAINVFTRDISQMVALGLQVFFWATPIVWDYHIMPDHVQAILRLNPVMYIVEGYRNSFIMFQPFWADVEGGLIFWGTTLLFFTVGAIIFKRLKPHFSEVL